MSLVHDSLPPREAGHSSANSLLPHSHSYAVSDPLDDKSERAYSAPEPYDHTIYDDFYDDGMEDHEGMAPSHDEAQATANVVPALPQKSALRASRLLDNLNLNLKLGVPFETAEAGRMTPHDVYMSSEEDASSSADDFSDYDYDSSNDSYTHSRRSSHEDTAKLVSVIFSGKPSLVDLSARRRSISPTSINNVRGRSDTLSSTTSTSTKSPVDRPSTPSSLSSLHLPSRKNSLLAEVMGKKKPPFLNIDPYANGSTYSLEQISKSPEESKEASPLKRSKTPTKDMFKGVTRTFSLVKKRSRPLLNTLAAANAPPAPRETMTAPPTIPAVRPISVAESIAESLAEEDGGARLVEEPQQRQQKAPISPPPMSPPVTYHDIMMASKKNAKIAAASPTISSPSPEPSRLMSPPPPPMSPTGLGAKRGILSGFAARRRSIKLTGKVI